jgi:hypothetical protein
MRRLPFIRKAWTSGTAASVVSALVLMWRGKVELDASAAPVNGPSQWILGKMAPYHNSADVRHTATGYVIHHGASVFWAIFYELARRLQPAHELTIGRKVKCAALVSGTAYTVDFIFTPQRLRPGFEKRLSAKSLVYIYAGFAIGLLLGAAIADHRE